MSSRLVWLVFLRKWPLDAVLHTESQDRNQPHWNRLRLLDVGDACLQHVEATLKHAVLSDGRHLRRPDTLRYHQTWLQCGAPKIAKLVNITPITMVYGTYNYS